MISKLESYKGLQIPTPAVNNPGGQAIEDNFTKLVDSNAPSVWDQTSDPGTTDDIDAGFYPGSRWLNITTSEVWTCVDNTVGAALWQLSGATDLTAGTGISISDDTVSIDSGWLSGEAFTVSHGGTGATSLTTHGVLIGEGAAAITATAAMTDGQLLVGQTGADPVPRSINTGALLDSTGAMTLVGPVAGATLKVDSGGSLITSYNSTINTGAINSVVNTNDSFLSSTSFASILFGSLLNQSGGAINTTTGVISGSPVAAGSIGRLQVNMGWSNNVSGNLGGSFGNQNTCSATNSWAFGSGITNSTGNSVAIGSSNTNKLTIIAPGSTVLDGAAGGGGLRFGSVNTTASGNNSITMGVGSSSFGAMAVSLGYLCSATGQSSICLGTADVSNHNITLAAGAQSVSIGQGSVAITTNAVAIGGSTSVAGGTNALAIASGSAYGANALCVGATLAAGTNVAVVGAFNVLGYSPRGYTRSAGSNTLTITGVDATAEFAASDTVWIRQTAPFSTEIVAATTTLVSATFTGGNTVLVLSSSVLNGSTTGGTVVSATKAANSSTFGNNNTIRVQNAHAFGAAITNTLANSVDIGWDNTHKMTLDGNGNLNIRGWMEVLASGTLVGTIVPGSHEYNGSHYLTNATIRFSVGGTIYDHSTDGSSTHTDGTEDTLYVDTLAASTFNLDNDKVEADYCVTLVASATATRRVQAYVAGTAVLDSGTLTFTSGGTADIRLIVIRESATVLRVLATFSPSGIAMQPVITYTRVTGLTLSSTQIVKITGIATGTGAASGDVTAKLGVIKFLAAA